MVLKTGEWNFCLVVRIQSEKELGLENQKGGDF